MTERTPLEYIYTKTTTRREGENDTPTDVHTQLAVTMSPEQAMELVTKLTTIAENNGDLGVRMVFYSSPRENRGTGETFVSTSVVVQAKQAQKPRPTGFQGGGARKTYPQPGASKPDRTPSPPPSKSPVKPVDKKATKKGPPTPEAWEDPI